jgi:endonuclease-3 related protein
VHKAQQQLGYHPGEYTYPQDRQQQFEICLGSILTQNTTWKQAQRAVSHLGQAGLIDPLRLIEAEEDQVRMLIRPAGFFNQKTRYLIHFARFFHQLGERVPTRKQLLDQVGIGEETADSMLLYAFHQPSFVVDAYTRRWLARHALMAGKPRYREIQSFFEANLPSDVALFQEYHALIVEDEKQYRIQLKRP